MIQRFADWLVYDIFGLDASTALGEAINFFFYDTIKILILLFFISVIMDIINAYFPIERLRNYLTSRKLYGLQYFFAAFFVVIGNNPVFKPIAARRWNTTLIEHSCDCPVSEPFGAPLINLLDDRRGFRVDNQVVFV